MSSPTLSLHMSTSPMASPRSSVSSGNPSGPLLTPLDELDKSASEMVITTENEIREDDSDTDLDPPPLRLTVQDPFPAKPLLDLSSLPGTSSRPTFTDFSFPTLSSFAAPIDIRRPPSHSPGDVDDIALPTAGFSFGTCPSVPFLGTPTAEQGPFEYPESTSPTSATMNTSTAANLRETFALGMTHRRGSIVVHPHVHSTNNPSPPATRRSSTCSTITTFPSAGRRPSILHSSTIETTVPLVGPSTCTSPVLPPSTFPPPSLGSGPTSRRSSTLMFKQKPLPAPIPPSLLARRGSLPAAQLFGIPSGEQANRTRASYSAGHHVTTTAALYSRRQSMASESGMSSGSGATVVEGDGFGRRGSTRLTTPLMDPHHGGRRGSIPVLYPVHPPLPPSSLGDKAPGRSNSLSSSSRSSIASSRSSLSSSRSNFDPSSFSRPGSFSSPRSASVSGTDHRPPPSSFYSPSSEMRRTRQHGSQLSGLSSSEESNEEEEEAEEDLSTPGTSLFNAGQGTVPSAPTFMDPWSKVHDGDLAERVDGKSSIPLETPPLMERPPLETIDSDRTER
ncbi:hypothetical protein IAR55_006317 [Kwoniella newhampshirensis]|uniref:Uncharacterized protein n=1 Tax=Kwoniella newhampshirensis TaxID=1651941 RepID=A0AAW0YGQ8_9TREE